MITQSTRSQLFSFHCGRSTTDPLYFLPSSRLPFFSRLHLHRGKGGSILWRCLKIRTDDESHVLLRFHCNPHACCALYRALYSFFSMGTCSGSPAFAFMCSFSADPFGAVHTIYGRRWIVRQHDLLRDGGSLWLFVAGHTRWPEQV